LVRNLKDLYGILQRSYLKQNIGDNVDIFLQNKRKVKSIILMYFVVFAAVNGEYW